MWWLRNNMDNKIDIDEIKEGLGALGRWLTDGGAAKKEKSVEAKPVPIDNGRPKYSPVMNAWQYNKDKLQPNNMTRPERFVKIFDRLNEMKPEAERILSFGCSYGNECEALAKRFSNAEIVGLDIDHWVIAEARRRNKLDNVCYTDEIKCTGTYDIITCLMVLFCLEVPVPKDRWEKALRTIDRHLNEDGVVVIYTSQYDPAEILTNDKYEALNVFTRIHNRDGKEYFNGYYRKRFKL
jgi:2-polyprenyl-3-methyl-5-hydroxy-6-metoxy-1,4-benzoquinol methylase